jgi:hypothetical protein
LKESITTGRIFDVEFGKCKFFSVKKKFSGKNFFFFFFLVLEKNLTLETKLTLRRSYDQEDFKAAKIIFQSLVSSIDFVFQRHQVMRFILKFILDSECFLSLI